MKTIGIVIPAYNEKENILKLIKGIRKYINCIILIVDDSKDKNIKEILSKNKIKNIKYYNRGKKIWKRICSNIWLQEINKKK